MKAIKYEIRNRECVTLCPYGLEAREGEIARVGSGACVRCGFFQSHSEVNQLIACSYEAHSATDAVNSPAHYNQGNIECIDAIQSARGAEATKEFCVCNAMKYLWRLGHKDDPVQEAQKAMWYLQKFIEIAKKDA